MATTGEPPFTGVAVNVYCRTLGRQRTHYDKHDKHAHRSCGRKPKHVWLTDVKVVPAGGVAVASPVVELSACALVSTGAPKAGVATLAELDAGVTVPPMLAVAVAVYGVLGCRPLMGQVVPGQVALMHVPLLLGQSLTV